MYPRKTLLLLLVLLTAVGTLPGQRRAASAQPTDTLATSALQALEWRNIGPFRGGRSNAVAGVVGNDNIYYAGYTGGGVWKTEDAGHTWRNISDGFFATGSVGDIAVAESDPNVIYVGMGEHAVRGVMTSFGDGIYKSTDGGKTWEHKGLDNTRHIADIVIHPTDPEVVFVAAQGAVHGPSEERGIYKSTDGGDTWKKVLYVDENTGASSLRMDFTNPRMLYAATWEHRRYPWKVVSGGPGSAVWKSTDGGETWHKIVEGLPAEMGKIGVAVSRAMPQRVFAIVEAEKSEAGVYRSDDGGATWQHLTNNQLLTARSWYYMEIFADPQNAESVYVLNAPMMHSTDGGKTFSRVSVGHGDTHDLWINPDNSRNMILGDDGGAEISYNGGRSWSTLNNQPTAQFYRVNTDNLFPYNVYGGQQDNSSVVIRSRGTGGGITEADWTSGPGCESAYIAFDPDNPVVLYGGCYQGLIEALDTRTKEGKDIMEYPSLNLATQPKDMKYRFNWNAPIIASPHDPTTLYHAGNVVFKTTDGGLNWTAISPDLTRNDTTKQELGGGPFTNEGAGGENYNTIYYLIESPLEAGVLYAGSDCGLVHVTRNGGASWENITPADLPESSIHSIEVSPHDPATVYVAANRYKFDDFRSYTYKSTDYGQSWQRIDAGVRDRDFIKVIREDRRTPGLLYGGAERGFYLSTDGGQRWHHLQLNLPVVPINDLAIQDNDLVAATQGRAFWILDDLSALQRSRGTFAGESVKLYEPNKKTVRFSSGNSSEPGVGENPPDGVILYYYLAEATDSSVVTLDILDGAGEVIRSYSNQEDERFQPFPGGPPAPTTIPAEAGLNRFAWDFRAETLPAVPGVFVYGSYRGHRVAPGTYRARLTQGEQSSEVTFEIVSDPRLDITAADWDRQQAMLERVEGHIAAIHRAVNTMRKLKEQLTTLNGLLAERGGAESLVETGTALVEQMNELESELVESRAKSIQDVINWPGKLNAEFFVLKGKLDTHDPRVTHGVESRLQDLEAQWAQHQQTLEQLLETEVPAFNRQYRELNIPALILPGETEK
jgi:photosystem II stability/assembly factor-like uncharacterized protein